jgi:hypothetical protein
MRLFAILRRGTNRDEKKFEPPLPLPKRERNPTPGINAIKIPSGRRKGVSADLA